jgi:Cdc6-like AAA superfamily ATPase
MLSFEKSNFLIATVDKGKYHNKGIYYHDTIDNKNINNVDLFDILDEDTVRSLKKKMPLRDINILKKALIKNIEPLDDDLKNIYDILKTQKTDTEIKKIKIQDNGVIIPIIDLYKNDNEKANHIYIAGATGSGKTYYLSRYLKYATKAHPKKKIYVFSDVEEDDLIDKYKQVIRIKLNDELIDTPIEPHELKNSICIFDDIDSISNKKLRATVENLRDSLLKRGRHENIKVICTNHLLTDYKGTRILLSECSQIVFFPKSGSTNGINYLLSKYIGLNKKQVADIYNLPSRAVCIHKSYPQIVISDKEIYLL